MVEHITLQRLKEVLDYNSDMGIFIWKKNMSSRARMGIIAGCRNGTTDEEPDKYIRIRIDGKGYLAHRLAWLYVYGWLPPEVDHWDGNGGNNRISNLRAATKNKNQHNRRINKNNKLGVKGVNFEEKSGKYKVTIMINKKKIYVGRYDTINKAKIAHENAAIQYHKEFARVA